MRLYGRSAEVISEDNLDLFYNPEDDDLDKDEPMGKSVKIIAQGSKSNQGDRVKRHVIVHA